MSHRITDEEVPMHRAPAARPIGDTRRGGGYTREPASPRRSGPMCPSRLARIARIGLLSLAAALLAACGAGGGQACTVDADCAGGVCSAAGVCEAGPAGGGARDGGHGSTTDGGAGDAGGTDGGPTDGGAPGTCTPNHDGVVARNEVTLKAGLSATFRIATNATVDTAGTYDADGTRHWHLDGSLAGDHDVVETLEDPSGAWWAADYPNATYAARLRDGQDLFGVFQATQGSLLLLGVVSKNGGLTKTELTYDPAIGVLSFPVAKGGSWRTDATVTGYAQGVAAFYSESWVVRADDTGKLDTPYGTFDVVRVRVETTRTVGVVVTKTTSFLFESECFGTVASVFGNDNDTSAELTSAAEVDRIAP